MLVTVFCKKKKKEAYRLKERDSKNKSKRWMKVTDYTFFMRD